MFDSELDSFVKKFKDLWQSGLDAHLVVDTHAGQAWVDLLVRLGHAPGLQQHQPHQPGLQKLIKVRNGPARQHRRARQNAARLQNEESENKSIREEDEEVPNASKKDTENVDAPVVQAEADKLEENEIAKTFIEINDEVCNDQEYERSDIFV